MIQQDTAPTSVLDEERTRRRSCADHLVVLVRKHRIHYTWRAGSFQPKPGQAAALLVSLSRPDEGGVGNTSQQARRSAREQVRQSLGATPARRAGPTL